MRNYIFPPPEKARKPEPERPEERVPRRPDPANPVDPAWEEIEDDGLTWEQRAEIEARRRFRDSISGARTILND